MIVCPNCNHQNPDGAVQCEACYTPLPDTAACPNCGATVQTDASFCGQCGFNLKAASPIAKAADVPAVAPSSKLPDLVDPDPLVIPEPLIPEPLIAPAIAPPSSPNLDPASVAPSAASVSEENQPEVAIGLTDPSLLTSPKTQLQQQTARLLHVQTNTNIELPQTLSVIHLGKPNDRIPPDIDISGFPNSEIVSRIHADIRIEGDTFYIEDVGSSNGTYINNAPLPMGNRHRLRPGDRIALGKGDKVTFLFQLS